MKLATSLMMMNQTSDLRLIERLRLPCNWGFRRENKFSEGQRKDSLNRSGELGLREKSFLGKWQILRDMYRGKNRAM